MRGCSETSSDGGFLEADVIASCCPAPTMRFLGEVVWLSLSHRKDGYFIYFSLIAGLIFGAKGTSAGKSMLLNM